MSLNTNEQIGLKVQRLLSLMDADNTLTKEDFIASFEKVVQLVLQIQKQQNEAIAKLQTTYATLLERTKNDHTASLSDIKAQTSKTVEAEMSKMMKTHESEMLAMEKKIDGMMEVYEEMLDKMKEKVDSLKDGTDGKDAVIDAELVKNVAYLMDLAKTNKEHKVSGEVGQPERFLGGVVNSGVRFETPVGTVNGSTTVFTVFKPPKYIIVDGITYFEDNGYTLSGKTITVSVPPVGFIRSAY